MDDPFVTCPYYLAHRVPRSRLQKHIVKCEWRNKELCACPYNATHRYTKEDMKFHVINCPSKLAVFPEENRHVPISGAITTPQVTLQRDYLPNTDPDYEEWD